MVRICDASNFEGGQCQGIVYNIIYTRKVVYYIPDNIFDIFDVALNAFLGPIKSIELEFNGSSWDLVILSGVNSISRSTILGYSPNSKVELLSVKLFRKDGEEDNCGNAQTKCRCEPTDTTIKCNGQKGGICCIPNSTFKNLCSKLK